MNPEIQTKFCLFISRRIPGGLDFTDLPWDNQQDLTRIADAAVKIPYVFEAHIDEKTKEVGGVPWWGKTILERANENTSENYTKDEEGFRADLKARLQDDALFDRVYDNKRKYMESSLTETRKKLSRGRR